MFLHKILLMYILMDGSRSNPTFFKFFKPIKIEDSQIPASSVAYPETNQDATELLETEAESTLFLKPILIDSPNNEVPLRTETEHSSGSFFKPIRIGSSSKKQASFQFPVINKSVQKTTNGGPGRQTEQRTSLPRESNSFLPQKVQSLISQEFNLVPQEYNFFSPAQSSSFLPQESNSLPQESNFFLPQESSSLPQESNTLIPPESNSFIPQKLDTLVVKSTTTPAPETSKAIVQGFRVIGDPSNTVVFLDLKALKESGIDVSSPTISIGPNSLEIIEGLQTEAPTNEKPIIPASAPTDQRLTIPAPTFVTKATAQPPSSSEFESLKPSRLPESIKKFSVSLKSDKPPVFFSRKLSSSPSSSSQDFSNFPVESVSSSSSLGSRGFSNFPVKSAPSAPSLVSSNFPVKSSVFQSAPKVPLRHGLSGGLQFRQPDAGTSPPPASLSHLLVDDDPLVQLELLKTFKVPGSFSTSASASLSEGASSISSTGEESLKGADHLLSLQNQHHQQHQPQQIRQQEQEYLLRDHEELSSGEETLRLHGIHHLPPFQQHYPQRQVQLEQAQEQQQDSLHGEHSHISPIEETSDEALLIPLHQHQQQLRQHQQQLQQVRQQEQESIHGEHVEFSSGEEIPHAIHHVLPSQQQHVHPPQLHQQSQQDVQEQRDIHGEDHLLSGQETRNEVHHLLPLQQQQHQQHLHLHQQQLQEHQQQVDELKQQFQQLRKHQLQQLKQQQESIHRFSLPLEEEIAFNEDLEEAFRILG